MIVEALVCTVWTILNWSESSWKIMKNFLGGIWLKNCAVWEWVAWLNLYGLIWVKISWKILWDFCGIFVGTNILDFWCGLSVGRCAHPLVDQKPEWAGGGHLAGTVHHEIRFDLILPAQPSRYTGHGHNNTTGPIRSISCGLASPSWRVGISAGARWTAWSTGRYASWPGIAGKVGWNGINYFVLDSGKRCDRFVES